MIQTTEVLFRVQPHDGNDPIEATGRLPIVPRKGDMIEIWNAEGGWLNPDGKGGTHRSGDTVFAEVDVVVLCAYAPERIEVWLKFDTYDLDEVRQAMAAAERNDQP